MPFSRGIANTLGLIAALTMALGAHAARADDSARNGERIYRLAGCENCHTDREHGGARLAGGRKLATPLGTFITPNITPDAQSGIGRWSETDFRQALREGMGPEGKHYYPSFPYTSYTRLNDRDIHDLWTYLRAQPAVRQANKDHDLPWYLRFRFVLKVWKWLFFKPGAYQDDPGKTAEWNRGAYLVQGAGHCAECHTPRNVFGGFKSSLTLAGTLNGPDGIVVPNITPDTKYGIGAWKPRDLADYLASGNRPDGDAAGSLMAEVIDNGLRHLERTDLDAMSSYLSSQPGNANPVVKSRAKSQAKKSDDF
jgi:mono/diheme cytochrome c family protein